MSRNIAAAVTVGLLAATLMKFLCCIAFLAVAVGSPANAQGRAINSAQTEEGGIKLPGTDFAVLLEMGERHPYGAYGHLVRHLCSVLLDAAAT
jgi:hypothetical protein